MADGPRCLHCGVGLGKVSGLMVIIPFQQYICGKCVQEHATPPVTRREWVT